MKKIILFVAAGLMLLSTGANAQFKSSKLWIGGSVGFSSTSIKPDGGGDSQSGSSFRLVPEIGYRQSKDWGFGLGIGYLSGYGALGSINVNDIKWLGTTILGGASDYNNIESSTSAFFIAPFARKYFTVAKNFALFLEGGVNFISGKAEIDGDDDPSTPATEQKMSAFEIGIRPGFQYTFNKRVTLFGKLGNLGYQSITVKDAVKVNRFGIDFDSGNIIFGFTYNLK